MSEKTVTTRYGDLTCPKCGAIRSGAYVCPTCDDKMKIPATTCQSQGTHLFGANGKCVFCKARRPDVIDEMTIDQQKKLLADTFADSVLPLIDTVLRKRCEQWVEEIYNGLHKGEKE